MTNNNLPGDNASLYANIFSYMGLPLSRDLGDDSIGNN